MAHTHSRLPQKLLLAAGVFSLLMLSATIAGAQEQSTNNQASTTTPEEEIAELRRKVQKLDAEVSRLRLQVAKLEKYQQIDYLRDLLMKEEQRAEVLQAQLFEIGVKEGPLQDRVDEIDGMLRPQALEQSMAGVGSTRPEETRDAVRNRLGNERRRLLGQLELLRQSRMRLQSSLSTSDASISRLKQRLSEVTSRQ